MLIDDVRPTTLDGVKSLATQLRKEQGIKHTTALDLAAKAANCENFRHALRVLPMRSTAALAPYVFLTSYWQDKEQQYQLGRETLRIELSRPILEICGKSALKKVRGFGDLRMVADDHFVCDTLADTQAYARERLCTAERSLRFMEHTGLLPSREYRKAYQSRWRRDDGLPDLDHPTYWVDSASGQFILVDEPYSGVPNEAMRATWAASTGHVVVKTSWPGMYNPYNCDLYVATNMGSSYDLDALVAKIDAIPAPLRAEEWHGESSSWDTFLSPLAQTIQDRRRARSKGTIYPVSNSTTVPYRYDPGSRSRRPAAKMTLEEHIETGRIIKAVIHSNQSTYAVCNRMNSLRSTLEDWMCLEIDRRQLNKIDFVEVYYSEAKSDAPYHAMAKSRGDIIKMLGDLKQRLQAAYPNCAPLRKQLHRIGASIRCLERFNLLK